MCARDRIQAGNMVQAGNVVQAGSIINDNYKQDADIQDMVQDLQAEAHDLQAVQEYLRASSKFRIFGWNTKGTSGWRSG